MNKQFRANYCQSMTGRMSGPVCIGWCGYMRPAASIHPPCAPRQHYQTSSSLNLDDHTGPMKLWLAHHHDNPYPSRVEKVMLAILCHMTLTQVSTWFANARRRLKKHAAY